MTTPQPQPQPGLEHELPDSGDFWIRRDGDWRIVFFEASHSCQEMFAGCRGHETVSGIVSDLPKGHWHQAVVGEVDTDPDQILAMAGPHWVCEETKRVIAKLTEERDDARARLLTAAGDDLCRLSQEEIKAMSAGEVKIPPKEEFLASCEQFHAQIAKTVGVNNNCLTLAQLIAENEKFRRMCCS